MHAGVWAGQIQILQLKAYILYIYTLASFGYCIVRKIN